MEQQKELPLSLRRAMLLSFTVTFAGAMFCLGFLVGRLFT